MIRRSTRATRVGKGRALSRFPFPVSRRLAYQRLRQPKREALLPDAGRALKQEGLRQPAGGDRACQPVSGPLMTVEGGDWHGGNLVWGGKTGLCSKRNTLCHKLLCLFLGACASLSDYMLSHYHRK